MSNNKQQVELTGITAPLLSATKGFTMEDRDASIGLLLDFAKRGRNRGKQRPPSICKVPSILRDLSVSSFIPQLVSIGPIHREDPKLQEFEWLKESYLDDLLNRCHDSTPKETLEACLERINDLIPRMRESYNAGVIEKYSDVELAGMMVKDGCFILEFCFKHEEENEYLPNKMQNSRIAMDLMLLENQVPFSVLQALFDCLAPYISKKNLTLRKILDTYLARYIKLFLSLPEKKSILKLFCSLLPETIPTTDVDSDFPKNIPTTDSDSDSTHDHVLGYLYKRYQLGAAKSSKPIRAESSNPIKNAPSLSIVELGRSGMKFKPHQEATLLMPTLVIDDTTELILRNFIAYEQSFPQDRYYFTSYARAMDMLIDTQEDIAKLVESKVLVNTLSSNQEAADMINKICKNIYVRNFYYTKEFEQMDKYNNGFWPTTRRISLSYPWNAISLLFGIIVSIFTLVSAIFTILEYFR